MLTASLPPELAQPLDAWARKQVGKSDIDDLLSWAEQMSDVGAAIAEAKYGG